METYNGHVRTPNDAIILFEACRLGLLPRVQRRLSEKERQSIRSGSVFVWDEREAGMRRWTDGKSWSASRVSGSFLTYREMEGKRGGNNFVQPVNGSTGNKTPTAQDEPADGEEGPDGYRYKPDGLMKQSFSLTTSTGQHLHLISYFSRAQPTAQVLRQPSNDPSLASIQIPKGMYPESTIADASNTPAVTRSPMPGAPNYVMAAGAGYHRASPSAPPAFLPGYIPHPGYMYPISPLHTPPGHYPMHYALPPGYYHPAAFAPPPPHHLPISSAPPSSYDQRPLGRPDIPPSPHGPPQPQRMPQVVPPFPLAPQLAPHEKMPIPTTSTHVYPITPGSERSSSLQLDPRLSEQTAASQAPQPPQLTASQSLPLPPTLSPRYQQPAQQLPPPHSQHHDSAHSAAQPQLPVPAPSITSLVNAAAQATPLPTGTSKKSSEGDRGGSVSPGGTRTLASQDIPSEKLGFSQDKMALSKLDRVFARV